MKSAFTDIDNALDHLEKEIEMLRKGRDQFVRTKDNLNSPIVWLIEDGIVYAVDGIYSAIERLLLLVADRIDGHSIFKSDDWDRVVLVRMKHPFPSVREAIVDEEVFARLEGLRIFRNWGRGGGRRDVQEAIVLVDDIVSAFGSIRSAVVGLMEETREIRGS